MKNNLHLLCFIWLFSALLVVIAPRPGLAAQEIVLTSDQSQLVKLADVPATVVVGNPSIADVTTDGRRLFFHPRGYGVTNVLVLDADGKKLGDYLVRIIYEDSYSVAMHEPGGRKTYSCRRDCEPVLRIGDETEFFDDYRDQAQNKSVLASWQALGEEFILPNNDNPYVVSFPVPGN